MFIFLDIDGVLNKESDWSKQFSLSSDCIRRFCEKYRTDMMRWIGLMNNIRSCVDEIVLNDIVYS